MSKRLLVLLVFSLSPLLVSCGSDSGGTDPDPSVPTSLTVSPETLTLEALGATAQFSATVRDQHGQVMAGATVSWASDDPAVLSIDGTSGLATAVAVGTTTVRATAGTVTASAAATVEQVATQAQAALEAEQVEPGGQTQASLTVADANGNPIPSTAVSWTSSDPGVAEVDDQGVVSALSPGLAYLKGTHEALSDSVLLSVSWALDGEQIAVTTDAAGEVAIFSDLEGGTHFQVGVEDDLGQPLEGATVEYGEVGGKAFFAIRSPGGQHAPAFLYGDVETLRDFGDPFAMAQSYELYRHPLDTGPQPTVGNAIRVEITLPSITSAQIAAIQNALVMATFLFDRGQYEIGLDGVYRGRMCLDWEEIAQLLTDRLTSIPGWMDLVITFIRDGVPTSFDPAPVAGEADVYFSAGDLVGGLTAEDLLAAKIELLGEMLLESTNDRKVEVQWEFGETGPASHQALGVLTILTNDGYCAGGAPASLVAIQDTVKGAPGSTREAGVIAYDEYDYPVTGVDIWFEINEGSGSLAGLPTQGGSVQTDTQGRATVDWTLPEALGTYELRAWVVDDELVATEVYAVVAEASTVDPVPTDLAAGNTHTCALTPDNIAYCWGRNGEGEVGNGESGAMAYVATPAPVEIAPGTLVSLSVGESHSCGLAADGTAYCWGQNDDTETGAGDRYVPVTTPQEVSVPAGLKFISVSPGSIHTCGLATNQQAYCWGSNEQGQLGDPTATEPRQTASPVSGSHIFESVVSGGVHSCGLTSDGTAWCWGDNRYGQIDADTSGSKIRPEPVMVPNQPGGLQYLVAGWYHTCGVTWDGSAYCWGWTQYGQIGSMTVPEGVAPPTQVELGSGIQQLAAGGNHTCAIGSDGLSYCWGNNSNGQLGDGTKWNQHTPTLVSTDNPFVLLSVGAFHTCGLTDSGEAWCWGDGAKWQLGYGDFDPFTEDPDRLVPELVAGGHTFGRPAASLSVSLDRWPRRP